MTAPTGLARAPVPSLGVVLVGCPDCRAALGVDGAPGLAAALAAHRRTCAKRPHAPSLAPPGRRAPSARPVDDVCPGCGCEAELYPRADGWRCGDCLAELLSDTLDGPPAPAPRPQVRAVPARPRHGEDQAAGDPEPVARAVA
jgi:hypothetical protein